MNSSPPPQDVDMDALFADIDDDIDIQPLPPRIDEQEMSRQAELTHMQALTPHEILPSSPPQPDPSSKGNAEKATRRKLVKLDENRLLNPTTGFPQLIKMTKGFKLKGKGHEVRLSVNLSILNLLFVYRPLISTDSFNNTNTGLINSIQKPSFVIPSSV